MPLSRAGDATSGSFARIQCPFLMLRLSYRSLSARLHRPHFTFLLALSISWPCVSLSLSLLMLYRGSPRQMLCRPHTPTACSLCRCWCWNPDRVQAPPAIVHLCICTANIVVPASFCSDDPFLDVDSRGSFDGWGCFWDCCALTGVAHWCKAETRIHTATSTRLMILCIKYGRCYQ